MSLMLCELSWQCVILTGWIAMLIVVGIVFVCYYLLKFYVLPKQNAKYEKDMKKNAFDEEKYWYFQKNLKQDFKKELEERIEKLKKEKEELSKQIEKEKEDRKEILTKERIQAEHDFYEKVLSQFYPTGKNQSNK